MNRDFDFDDIGKKTPYRVPEAFFDNLQQEVLRRSGVRRRFRLRPTVVWAACVAAAFVAGLVFMPLFAPEENPRMRCRHQKARWPWPMRATGGFMKCLTRSWKSSPVSRNTICF